MKPRAVLLVRVSTKEQETERQVFELRKVAEEKGWNVVGVVKEAGVSGTLKSDDRPGIQQVLELARAGVIDKVLVHEVSRIARRNSVAHAFLDELCDLGVSLYWHQQGIETLLANGRRNPAATIMFALLAEMARSERETLVDRINSGLEEARRKGVRLGRPPGTGDKPEEVLRKHKDIVRALGRGLPVRVVAAMTKRSTSTVQAVRRVMVGDEV
jgi:DNA invertase Pin-like site-specific DNA recombinase